MENNEQSFNNDSIKKDLLKNPIVWAFLLVIIFALVFFLTGGLSSFKSLFDSEVTSPLEKDQLQILDELQKGSVGRAISPKERQKILEDLSGVSLEQEEPGSESGQEVLKKLQEAVKN